MSKRVLITGVSGFAGSYLAEYLLSQRSYEIQGTYLSEHSLGNVKEVQNNIVLVKVNLIDPKETARVVRVLKPNLIFHLAALPAVGESFMKPLEILTNNVVAQLNLLEAVKNVGLYDCRILIVSSADVYGKVLEKDLPIDENTPFMPTNTYAVSKITQDFLGLQYFLSYRLKIIRVRPFNHIGPRQLEGFVIADFAKKIAEIEKGKRENILRVGDLSTRRDFTDVRDIVRAYVLITKKGRLGDVYNVGSGISYKIAEVLDMLLSLSMVKIKVKVDSQLLRPEDAIDRRCDNRKLTTLTGWRTTIPIEQTLKDTLEYWRNIV